MRRLISIAAFSLLLTVPVWAQHGGGGGHAGFSGGGHGGFSGGGHASSGFSGRSFSGGYSGARSYSRPYSGVRSGAVPSRSFNRFSTSRGTYLHNGIGFRNGFRNGVNLRGNGYRNCYVGRCGGWGYGYPWWGYDPWLWGSGYDNYDQDYYQNLDIANQMNEQSLEEQQMRQQEESDQDAYVRPPLRPRPSPTEEKQADTVLPATILIFRDQHKEEVHNYAIVGATLWNFSPQHTERIAVADLDLAATTKANEDRGITFRIPASGQGPATPPTNMQGQPPAPATRSSSSV